MTEYACPRDYLESRNCFLSSEQHDITIDLQPLSRVGGEGPPRGWEAGGGPRAAGRVLRA